MDEYDMTEQDLREEHLQQITGGCIACDWHTQARDAYLGGAANAKWLAEAHVARGLRSRARSAATLANLYTKEAKEQQKYIDAKRGTAGHPPALGESSNAVPDLNQLRLQ
jgi:hypothetical protein